MVRDPNFERYEGMVTLEDPLYPRKRGSFRVDEDGNVIYRYATPRTAGDARPHNRAPAGILSWDEADRRLDAQSAPVIGDITGTAARGSIANEKRGGVVTTRKTIGDVDYDVISANSYDPALSNGKTAIPNADTIAAMNSGKWYIAVRDAGPERGQLYYSTALGFHGQGGRWVSKPEKSYPDQS